MIRHTWLRIAVILCAVLAATGINTLTGQIPARASSTCGAGTYTATSGNTTGDSLLVTWLTDPTAHLYVTPNYNPNAVYDNHPVGVYWAGSYWAIFNEDQTAMPIGATFNIGWSLHDSTNTAFVQTATSSNSSGDSTFINNAATNNTPNAIIIVTQDWNATGTYNPHPIGVWYNGSQWAIYNQDLTAMPLNAAFNVLVFPNTNTSNPYNSWFSQTSSASNSGGDSMYFSQEAIDAAEVMIFVTPAFNLGGWTTSYYNHNPGVWYNSSLHNWGVFAEDQATMPTGSHFMVLALNCTP